MEVAILLESFGQPFHVFPDDMLVGRDCLFRVERRDGTATLAVEAMWNGTEGSRRLVHSINGLCGCVKLLPSPVPAILAAGGYLLRIWYSSAIKVNGVVRIHLITYRARSAV